MDNSSLDQIIPLQILIAEDNDINRILIQKIFERLGLKYDVAVNGEDAYNAFDNKFYDLVFMDIEMPLLTGFEVTKKLRGKYENQPRQPFIVALTANSLQGEKERCIEQGMNDYLSKPFSTADVQKIVEKATERIN